MTMKQEHKVNNLMLVFISAIIAHHELPIDEIFNEETSLYALIRVSCTVYYDAALYDNLSACFIGDKGHLIVLRRDRQYEVFDVMKSDMRKPNTIKIIVDYLKKDKFDNSNEVY